MDAMSKETRTCGLASSCNECSAPRLVVDRIKEPIVELLLGVNVLITMMISMKALVSKRSGGRGGGGVLPGP